MIELGERQTETLSSDTAVSAHAAGYHHVYPTVVWQAEGVLYP